MINLFNLFLFLLAFWAALMVLFAKFTLIYFIAGIFCAAFVAIISFRLKIVSKDSELLYMSFGFYKYFFLSYFASFFGSILLIVRMAFNPGSTEAFIFDVEVPSKYKINPALLMTNINLLPGFLTIGVKNEGKTLLVHGIDRRYLSNFDSDNLCSKLDGVNDDNLV